jgi:hypothetical protein
MALKGRKPEKIEKRLKALFYGAAGVGKTTASIQFPSPYLIDCEKGAENDQYVALLKKSGGAIFQTADFNELIIEIKSLLTEKHEYKTLIIDPLTTLYNDLLDKAATKVGTEFGRHYGEANKSMKHLMNLLVRLDMNVIITSHAKNEYGEDMKLLGQTFDCYKKLDYLFDLVFEIQKRGKQRIGLVKKTRIESFSETETFPFSYDEIAEKYGRAVLERGAVAQQLATEDQLKKIAHLIELLKVAQEIQDKWLTKSEAATFEEMSSDDIQKYIDFLNSKIKGEDA